jgi:hypothetical protein
LSRIGPDLKEFGDLSMIDRDRASIAWLIYDWLSDELPKGSQVAEPTLMRYIEHAEEMLRNHNPAKWVDLSPEMVFIAGSTFISDCLRDVAKKTHAPQLFGVEEGPFLRSFVHDVWKGHSADAREISDNLKKSLGYSSEFPEKGAVCALSPNRRAELDALYQVPKKALESELIGGRFEISPYPSLIAANYLAAIGAVDTGVLLLEDWIKRFNEKHDKFVPEDEPQLGWYLFRAKLSAGNLRYSFGGVNVHHRQLVSWHADETNQLARMIRVGDSDGWKRLCDKLLSPTLHNNIGQGLAFVYATERFYLFENLEPRDFVTGNNLGLSSLTDYLHEAEIIRAHQACMERVPGYSQAKDEYKSYFNLYTAQLRLILLALKSSPGSNPDPDRRKSLIEAIEQDLDQANHFGTPAKPSTLLGDGFWERHDIWERHRGRLELLRAQLEEAKRDSGS